MRSLILTFILALAVSTGMYFFLPEYMEQRVALEYSEVYVDTTSESTQGIVAKIESVTTKQEMVAEKTITKTAPLVKKTGWDDTQPTEVSIDINAFGKNGIIKWTNIFREQNGLQPLSENILLNSAATVKANDILKQQYFEHTSPDGLGASDLATSEGYEYLSIGENLALGNYKDSEEVVSAWMESPGHRANILNSKFEEIGIGAVRGVYDGYETWVAVQIFGRPVSSCPAPSVILKNKIDLYTTQIATLENTLEKAMAQIDSASPKHGPEYNKLINEYNLLAEYTNGLIAELKNAIDTYNIEVRALNSCVLGE